MIIVIITRLDKGYSYRSINAILEAQQDHFLNIFFSFQTKTI